MAEYVNFELVDDRIRMFKTSTPTKICRQITGDGWQMWLDDFKCDHIEGEYYRASPEFVNLVYYIASYDHDEVLF